MSEQLTDWTAVYTKSNGQPEKKSKKTGINSKTPRDAKEAHELEEVSEPTRLENGKWACNHKCRDKSAYVNREHLKMSQDSN